MSNPTLIAYHFFRSHKILFFSALTILLAIILYFASKIRFEEDITGVIHKKNDKNDLEYVMGHYKFSDKLIIRIYSDEKLPANPVVLTDFAREFSDSLLRRFDSSYIRSMTGNLNDSAMSFYSRFFLTYLPLYLEEKDYDKIDTLTRPESIRKAIDRDFKTLVSPAGFAVREQILRDPLGLSYIVLEKLRYISGDDRYKSAGGFVMTRDDRNLLLFLSPANPVNETSRNGQLLKGIDDIFSQLQKKYGNKATGQYFGAIAMSCANADQLKKDIALTLAIALVLIVLLIGWYFRSIKIPLLSFLPALFGGGLALALLFFIKGHISAIALGLGSVILGLIVDYALYLINHYRKYGNMETALGEMTTAIFLCALTSAGAFLCLVFLRSSVLHDLGWFAGISVLGAAFFTLFILPHFLNKKDALSPVVVHPNFVDRISRFPFEKKLWIIIAFLLLGAFSFITYRNVRFETSISSLGYFPEKLNKAEKDINRITGVSLKNVYLVSTDSGLDKALQKQERIYGRIRDLKEKQIIRQSSGPGWLLLSDSLQNHRISLWKKYWTPEKTEEVSKILLQESKKKKFKSTAFDSFISLIKKDPQKPDLKILEKVAGSMLPDWVSENNRKFMVTTILRMDSKDKDAVYKAFEGEPGVVLFDRQLLTEKFVETVNKDFDSLVKLSMIFVTVLLFLSFGRIEIALTTALPMYFAWLITLGFMGLTGIRFNIFNIILSSFVFGLGVDYSILMMRGLLFDYKYGTSGIPSYKSSIFLSSVTTLFGICALFFARHPALNSIALISLVGIVAVVLISYTFQPLIIHRILIRRLKMHKFPVTARIVVKSILTWGNITFIAIIMVIAGVFINLLFFLPRRKKEYLFHCLFSGLCKAYIFVTFPSHRTLIDRSGSDFRKPAIIIGNHQSLIETPAFLRLHPKILMLTNEWVWRSPLFGPVARLASFFNVERGLDPVMDKLREKVKEGYSIVIFPEGHRSTDHHIQRFHRGAFYLAEKLQIDIMPVLVFGSGDFLARGDFWGKPNRFKMVLLPRVKWDDPSFGGTYSERAKNFRRFYIEKYDTECEEDGTGYYYRNTLVLNYLFKGPVLEWYLRVKMRLSGYYQVYNQYIPRKGLVLDLGCGYGFISYMLRLTSPGRRIIGVDYDAEKISVASHGFLKDDSIDFVNADLSSWKISPADGIVISDVLHYLPMEEQSELLQRCFDNLNPGGVIMVREADRDTTDLHRGTRFTEFLSTRFIGFNKTRGDEKKLFFTSFITIEKLAALNGLKTEIIEESKHTSNRLMVIRKA